MKVNELNLCTTPGVETLSQKNSTQKRAGRTTQEVNPEFKPQDH
jgi:hypothetical protein